MPQGSSYPQVVSPDQACLQHLATSQRQRQRLQTFVILEDTIADSQPNHIVDQSILGERHPNSLSESPSQSSLTGDRNRRKLSGIYITRLRESTSSSIDPATKFVIPEILDSKQPAPAIGFSDMSQPSTPAGTQFRASSEIPGSGLREKLRNLRAGSRIDAEDRKSNRRRFDQAQSSSIRNELTVRANLSQSVEPSTTISITEQESVNKPPDSPSVREVAQVSSSIQSAPRSPLFTREPAQGFSLENRTVINKPEDPHDLTAEELAQEYGRIETQPLQVPPDIPLPLRVPQNDPRDAKVQNQPAVSEELSSLSQVITPLHPQHLGKAEFVIPLGMNSRVRDQYVSIINYYARPIDDWPQQQIDVMLDRLNRITTHTDLDDGINLTQEDVQSEDLALWAESCSEKFRFLRHLFDAFRTHAFHLAIVARSGPTLDIVETFLKGHHVAYSRPDNFARSDPSRATGRLAVTLLPSGVEGSTILPNAANLVIALDGSFKAQDVQVVKLRAHLTRVDELAPVIHLLVYNSAEHVGRCISTTLDPTDRVRKIVSCLTQTGDDVGILLPEEPSPSAAAEEVVAFVEGGCNDNDWPLLPIRPIEGTVAIEFSQAAEATRTDTQIPTGQKVVAPSTALKRALVRNRLESFSIDPLR